jgi:hypothetical protein
MRRAFDTGAAEVRIRDATAAQPAAAGLRGARELRI